MRINKHSFLRLSKLCLACLMLAWPPSAYCTHEGGSPHTTTDTTTTSDQLPTNATTPNTQSTADMDVKTSALPADPLSTPPISDISASEREAREAQSLEYFKSIIRDPESREWAKDWARELASELETPHSDSFRGYSQVTDTISAPPAKEPASTKTEYLGGGFYGNVLPAGAPGKAAAKNESAAADGTSGAAGDIKKMQDTSRAGPPPPPPIPKDMNEFAEYMESLRTSDNRDATKASPSAQQKGPAEPKQNMRQESSRFTEMSNTMETRHDTTKNAVNNVR